MIKIILKKLKIYYFNIFLKIYILKTKFLNETSFYHLDLNDRASSPLYEGIDLKSNM